MVNYIIIGLLLLNLSGTALALYQFRRVRKYIGLLSSDLSRPYVTPELIKVWKKKIKTFTPGSHLYEAYKKSLIVAGAWDGD